FALGAPFIGALEIVVYAGAIMVLFVFVVMLLNLGPHHADLKSPPLAKGLTTYIPPVALGVIFLAEASFLILRSHHATGSAFSMVREFTPKEVAIVLFRDYWPAVEMVSIILLAGLLGAYHIGRHQLSKRASDGHQQ